MKENLDYFKIQSNNVLPQKGRVLVAEPFLQDSYFKRSVVLITEHNDEGTVGFVLNNSIDFEMSDILKEFPPIDALVSIGGPVRTDTVHYIHTLGDRIKESVHVYSNIYWGGDVELVKEGIREGWIEPGTIRFFVGFSSWYPGQLNKELNENSWLVTQVKDIDIMTGIGFEFWEKVLMNEGERYQLWTRYPEDPMWN